MQYFQRIGHVELLTGEGSLLRSYRDLDFKFHVKKTIGGVADKATVSILGLNDDSISYLSTFTDDAHQLQKNWRMRVYAGYADEGEHLIIDGDIIRAVPTMPPENWLNVTVMCNAYRNSKMISVSSQSDISSFWSKNNTQQRGLKITEVLNRFVKWAGYDGWRYDNFANEEELMALKEELSLRIKSFDCSGTQYDIINELNDIGDFYVREEDNSIVISPPLNSTRRLPNSRQGLEGADLRRVRYISEDTGLVGLPQYKYPFCSITTRITSGIKVFDIVELKCRYNVQANGKYKVMSIVYDGHLRGEPWFARLNAQSLTAMLTEQEKKNIEKSNAKK